MIGGWGEGQEGNTWLENVISEKLGRDIKSIYMNLHECHMSYSVRETLRATLRVPLLYRESYIIENNLDNNLESDLDWICYCECDPRTNVMHYRYDHTCNDNDRNSQTCICFLHFFLSSTAWYLSK